MLSRLRTNPALRERVEAMPPSFDRLVRPRRFRQRRFVADVLRNPSLLSLFRTMSQLPSGYGRGLDERVVEHPWVLAQDLPGRLLDAGAALNHGHIVDYLIPRVSSLCIATAEPEPVAFIGRGISYVYADLRSLPFRDAYFDTIVSISTLEHVGMDNSRYGLVGARATDVDSALTEALDELVRVLRPGGSLFVSVPYGMREDHGWMRQFDRPGVERFVAASQPSHSSVVVYEYSRTGWQLSDLEAAAAARYRDRAREPRPADDASNARAVACIHLKFG